MVLINLAALPCAAMYRNIPPVLSAQELLEKAFSRANKATARGSNRLVRERSLTDARLNSLSDTIISKLKVYIKMFPSLNREARFEEAMIDLVVGVDKLKHSLGALSWAAGTIGTINKDVRARVKRTRDAEAVVKLRKEAYGRMSSVIKRIDGELSFLAEAREKMRDMPDIDPMLPTVVVAGAPNVGKSMLVALLSTAKPKVASYPFTTKEIHVGVFTERRLRYQVLDTPGLLDRPLNQRNPIEKQAVLALQYLPHTILFLVDPTEECGTTFEEQMAIFESLKSDFPRPEYIVAYGKKDLMATPPGEMGVSALTGDGVEELRGILVENLFPLHEEIQRERMLEDV